MNQILRKKLQAIIKIEREIDFQDEKALTDMDALRPMKHKAYDEYLEAVNQYSQIMTDIKYFVSSFDDNILSTVDELARLQAEKKKLFDIMYKKHLHNIHIETRWNCILAKINCIPDDVSDACEEIDDEIYILIGKLEDRLG